MVNYQWNIFWANLNPTKGSEQGGLRPVLVISNEDVNKLLPIVTVISLTSIKSTRKVYPTEVFLSASATGLPKDSIAMSHQVRTIAKERLQEKGGSIDSFDIKEKIKGALKKYLDI